MALKSFQARIVCQSADDRRSLELTHRLFNDHLRPVIRILYAARQGKCGPEFQRILRTIKSAQQAHGQVEAITSLKAKTGEGGRDGWKNLARSMVARGEILFDRDRLLPGFSSDFRRKVFDMTFQIILGHRAKLGAWRKDHKDWKQKKDQWEAENPQYMTVRPIIERFSESEGKVAKRRGRWHRWLDFMASQPELAAWRGAEPTISPLTTEEWAEAKRVPRKTTARAFRAFFDKNPELGELDRVHGFYQREYVRPWAKRRHSDGFRHPPTLTLPSVEKHPVWFPFQKDVGYRRLDLQNGTVELKVIQSDNPDERSPRGLVAFRFESDRRLKRFHRIEEPLKSHGETCDLLYHGAEGHGPRPATVKGIKLVFREGHPYLYFTVYVEDAPSRLELTQSDIDKYGHSWAAKKIRAQALSPPLRTMAIDLGIRHIAVATVMQDGRIVASRFLHNRPTLLTTGKCITGIATLEQIAAMKRELRRRLRQRGKPAKGRQSCRQLSAHISHMSEDRFKKCAAAIVDYARAQKVDAILMEKLEGLIPDAERERGINRAIVNWNRGQLCRCLKMLAESHGLRTIEVAPYWTSHVCHRCNRIGVRFSLQKEEMNLEPVGKLFGCPSCGYRANADFNASVNLHRVFWGTFPEAKKLKGEKSKLRLNGETVDLAQVRQEWVSRWPSLNTPF